MAHHRRPFVGGNWKMNTDLASAVELADDVVAGCEPHLARCDVAVFPPFPYLQAVGKTLGHHGIRLGAQDVFHEPDGAFTGEVSTDMLQDLNVAVVIVGHSERRHVIGESDELVNRKLRAVVDAGLAAILCVGETHQQRQAGATNRVIVAQLMASIDGLTSAQIRQVTIAYEPIWAVGTGVIASAAEAAPVHRIIRASLADLYDDAQAREVRIQYGGSVKAFNSAELAARPEIDGFLVGSASLIAGEFTTIVRAAAEARKSQEED